MSGFMVQVKIPGERDWVGNAVVFATEAEAQNYGEDLFCRWTVVSDWRLIPTDKEPKRPTNPPSKPA